MTLQTIQIRRSNTQSSPTALANGELAYSYVSNTLFIGDTANGVIPLLVNTTTSKIATVYEQANAQGTYANGTVVVANVANINWNNTATMNVAVSANGNQTNVGLSVNTSAITNVISLNVSSNISNVGNIAVTQNLSAGNIAITTNLSVANITMNSVSFIPSWTAITANNSGAPNNFSAAAVSGADAAGYWIDPFGIVHLRGLISNGTGNIAMANVTSYARNVANGFPAPTAQVMVGLTCSNVVAGVGGNVLHGSFTIFPNGALQCFNVSPYVTTANLVNVSIYSVTYSKV